MNPIEKAIASGKPCAIVQRRADGMAHLLVGEALRLEHLRDIPRKKGTPRNASAFDSISAIPFAQVRERGYRAHDDGAKILCIETTEHHRLETEELIKYLPSEEIVMDAPVSYELDDQQYADVVRRVVEEEIGNGEGANFVIPRTAFAKIADFSVEKALSIFRRILEDEYGSYWTFCFLFEGTYLVGATPERHLEVLGNRVRMNPISGTFRKPRRPGKRLGEMKRLVLEFLNDQKEINELFMVVDEELKMMARMCKEGGMIIGPLVKEMSNLMHTEYLLSGHSDLDVIDLLRETMFAATVTGGPVQNACRIIEKYEPRARRYYASALALIGRDGSGQDYLDSPILIRTLEFDRAGNMSASAGATLVRDSKPAEEVEETKAKARAVLSGLESRNRATSGRAAPIWAHLYGDDDVNEALESRNQHLSGFWFFEQDMSHRKVEALSGKSIIIFDYEDDFCHMMAHMIRRMACRVEVKSPDDFDLAADTSDVVIVGPGPGNPTDDALPRIARGYRMVQQLLESGRKFMAICLGHQLLCRALGIPIKQKRIPHQGTQEDVDFFGRRERVGFYNTFVGVWSKAVPGFEVSCDPETKEIHAIRSKTCVGFQFHTESILTENGYQILQDAVIDLLGL
jgi:phenazine biosynthesis protein phzE